jgi:protein tyrosine phosphatase (PTP) superfamily phosphohydrolase (DUF442 family)
MALTEIRNFVPLDADRGPNTSPAARIATAGQPSEGQLAEVAAAGYRKVVNLGLLDPKYCLADEAGLAASLGMEYRHIPVRFDAPTLDDFRAFVQIMDAWAGEPVFVHCAANYRVSSFMALYGELKLGWTRAHADEHARRLWEPNETWRSFLEHARATLG